MIKLNFAVYNSEYAFLMIHEFVQFGFVYAPPCQICVIEVCLYVLSIDLLFSNGFALYHDLMLLETLLAITYIQPNISRSKGNQAMNHGQLIKYNVRNICHSENVAGRLFADLFFEKALFKIKASGRKFIVNMVWQTSTWTCQKQTIPEC